MSSRKSATMVDDPSLSTSAVKWDEIPFTIWNSTVNILQLSTRVWAHRWQQVLLKNSSRSAAASLSPVVAQVYSTTNSPSGMSLFLQVLFAMKAHPIIIYHRNRKRYRAQQV